MDSETDINKNIRELQITLTDEQQTIFSTD